MSVYPIILCGGAGTRLWPASRPERPKQFLALVGEKTIFQETVLRVSGLEGARPPLVAAHVDHAGWIEAQLAAIGVEGALLLEPEGRDSGPAIAAAIGWVAEQDPDGVAVVVASDHHIPDVAAFRAAVATGIAAARQEWIVTLGVKPTSPSSAYGYIRPGQRLGPVHAVEAFVEKPDPQSAETYVQLGYLWNSGNFIARADVFLRELETHAPLIAKHARTAVSQAATGGRTHVLGAAFRKCPKISVDYAVMEKTARTAVLPVDFAWSDLGAWDAVWAAAACDANGNACAGDAVFLDARNCLARSGNGSLISVVGVENVGVIVEGDAVLVCGLPASQRVKSLVEGLGERGRRPSRSFAAPPEADHSLDDLKRWLFVNALPLWWSLGADHVRGGFHESLTSYGEPTDAPRRARVQARQAYVYASAGLMGWKGPWREASDHALKYLVARYLRPDGLYRSLVGAEGAARDDATNLYDQAFVLLAMATALQAEPERHDLRRLARDLISALASYRHDNGGFREAGEHAFQANANMHLLEACLAWAEIDEAPVWVRTCEELVRLCLERFIRPEFGCVSEFFDRRWRPAKGPLGGLVEPGHQFEWAYLLHQWSRLAGDAAAAGAIPRLYACGLRGVDAKDRIAIREVDLHLLPRDRTARFWAQTERLRAAVTIGRFHPQGAAGAREELAEALAGVWAFIDGLSTGLWRDTKGSDGAFVEGPAPASTLYHLVSCLRAATSGVHGIDFDRAAFKGEGELLAEGRSATL